MSYAYSVDENKTKITDGKVDEINDRVDGLKSAEGSHRDRVTQLENDKTKLLDTILVAVTVYEEQCNILYYGGKTK